MLLGKIINHEIIIKKNRVRSNEIPLSNRFDGILIEDDDDLEKFNNRHYNDDVNNDN